MFLELENLYITKLKIILQSRLFYCLLFVITLLIALIYNNKKIESKYNLNDKEFYMEVINIKDDGNKLSLTLKGEENLIGNYYYEGDCPKIKYGDMVYLTGSLKVPSNNTVPHTFNYRKYLEKKHINYVLNIKSIKVVGNSGKLYRLKNIINDRIDKIDNTGYMKAFVLGDKSIINEEDYNNYQDIGITHLFAISGMHIALLSEIFIKILKRFKNTFKYAIIDSFLLCYGFIVCFPASIRRCIVFYILKSLCKIFNIDLSNMKILFLTAVFIIICDPYIIFDVGFLFSICTVSGILLCTSYINTSDKVISLFRMSFVAFLFSLPISLFYFYQVNILSIFYNMLFVPYISTIVYPLSLLSLGLSFLSPLFDLSIKILEWSSHLLSSFKPFIIYMSFNYIQVVIFYLGLVLFVVNKQKRYICLLLCILITDYLTPFFDKATYVYFLDVGQGDATLVISPHKQYVSLIDTGGMSDYKVSEKYIPLLKYLGIKRINYLILTHGDFDHAGETINLLKSFTIDEVVFNQDFFNELELDIIDNLRIKNTKYSVAGNKLKNGMHILTTNKFDNENDNSNVVLFMVKKYKFLLMGDSSFKREEDLLKEYKLDSIDVLKVGHHGSKSSTSKSFVNSINPKYAIISVGKYNRYGHPNKEVLNNLKKSKIYRTDKNGSVVFRISDRLYIENYSP